MPKVQVQVSSPRNEPLLVTKKCSVESSTWAKNDVGTTRIIVPTGSSEAEIIAGAGNIIRVVRKGLPIWAGVVTTEEWVDGRYTLGLKSAEWLAKGKLTGQGRVYGANGGAAAGSVAADLFQNAAHQNNDLRVLQAGTFDASTLIFRTYDYADLFEALKKLAEDQGADFWVDDKLRVHFRNQRGRDKRDTVTLREGYNLTDVRIVQDYEEVVTAVIGLGEGNSIPAKSKRLLKQPNASFFRARVLNVSGAATPSMIEGPAREALRAGSQPRIAVEGNVAMINGAYADCWIGDLVRVITRHPKHRSLSAQVVGVEIGTENKLRLVLEVIPSNTIGSPLDWTIV